MNVNRLKQATRAGTRVADRRGHENPADHIGYLHIIRPGPGPVLAQPCTPRSITHITDVAVRTFGPDVVTYWTPREGRNVEAVRTVLLASIPADAMLDRRPRATYTTDTETVEWFRMHDGDCPACEEQRAWCGECQADLV